MIWFIVLNIVMNNGDVYSDLHYPTSPEFNSEEACNENGQALADQKQIEIGTTNGKTYFACIAVDKSDLDKLVSKTKSNS